MDPLLPNSHGLGAAAHSEDSHGADNAHSPPEKSMAAPEERKGAAHAGHAKEAHSNGRAQTKDSAQASASAPDAHDQHPGKITSAPQEKSKGDAHAGHAKEANSDGKTQSKDSGKSPPTDHGPEHSASADERTPVAKQNEAANSYEHPKGTLAQEATPDDLKRDDIAIPTPSEKSSAGKSGHRH